MNIPEEELQKRLKKAIFKTSSSEVGARASEGLRQLQHGSFSGHLLYSGL